ncbi:methyl jasmonate esterase 1-like [Impatiens glandulifera]|uniref:methyl jasmonate esterase 1-like n=1 Tax=Impatiens glandulifera TaxID=253017 RepID=UPI001FB167D3|nr:methyl jasmonate esterase 1-like [Impatiens glandulifera]
MGDKKEKHFVLIHGACHGAWCWYKVIASLKEAGHHRVTALDMAAGGIDPSPVEAVSTLHDYFRPLLDFMASLPSGEKVVLVGHSMGGMGISLAMEKFPHKISVAIFLAAVMPGPNLDYPSIFYEVFMAILLIEQFNKAMGKEGWMDSSYKFNNGKENPPTSMLFGPFFMSSQLYNLSPLEDLSLAHLLVRHFPMVGNDESSDTVILTEEKYGSVNRVYVIGEHELVYKQEFVKWMIEKNPVRQIMTISAADHMIMFSNPLDLCKCLQEIAAHHNI